MLARPKTNYPPGTKFNNWTVLSDGPDSYTQHRQLLCRCDCGNEQLVRTDTLKRQVAKGYSRCQNCRSMFHKIYAGTEATTRGLADSYIYQAWIDMRVKNGATHIPAWDDFDTFFAWFLEASGTQVQDHLSGRIGLSHYHIQRVDSALPWGPDNAVVMKFKTGRAFDERTYKYWFKLRSRNLLSPELHDDYVAFVNTFGNREKGYVLRRKSTRVLHNRDNSEWVIRTDLSISRKKHKRTASP